MPLNGPSPNGEAKVEALVQLLLDPTDRSARERVLAVTRTPIEGSRRSGETVLEAVIQVLNDAAKPMGMVEVREGVERRLGRIVAKSSVQNALGTAVNVRGGVARISRGLYGAA